MKANVEHETRLRPGPLSTAPSSAAVSSRRIIPNDGPAHLGGPIPSGPAHSAVPGARTDPVPVGTVAVAELVG